MINWDLDDIDEEFRSQVTKNLARFRRREWRPPIQGVPPSDEATPTQYGIVREIVPEVDVFGKYHLSPDAPMARALLKELTTAPLAQVTAHVADLAAGEMMSYTFFVPRKQISRLRKGHSVSFTIVGRSLPGGIAYRMAVDLRDMGRSE